MVPLITFVIGIFCNILGIGGGEIAHYRMLICMYLSMYVSMYVCMYVCMCVCVYIHIDFNVYLSITCGVQSTQGS